MARIFVIEKKNHGKARQDVVTTYKITNAENYDDSDPLSELDRAVLSVCSANFDVGKQNFKISRNHFSDVAFCFSFMLSGAEAADSKTSKARLPNIKNWAKNSVPPTREEVEKEIAMVKDVIILQDNDKRRTLLVRLDGNKLVNKIFGYIDTGIRSANVLHTWTIDKQNRKIGTVVVDLSQIIQESALAALNAPESNLPDEFRESHGNRKLFNFQRRLYFLSKY